MYIELGDNDKIEIEEIWAITECIICKKNLTLKNESCRSKLLPCLHAMCHKCFIRSCDKGELLCQCCSFSFNKEEIYDNKVLYEIVSDVDIPNTKNIVCSIHDAKVTHWCENCNEFICQDCVKHHGQLKSTRTHNIISKDCYISNLLSGTPKRAFQCDVHPKNELVIICHSCRAMTCRDCQLEDHKDHKYDFIVDQSDSVKDELYDVFKKVEFHALFMKAALSKITERESKIEELKKKIVSDIKKEFDLIQELVKKRANELMLSVIDKANTKLDECEENRQLLKRNLDSVEHCLKFVKCVLFTSSDPVLFYTKELMLNRMKRLHFVNRVPCAVDVINLSFSSENVEETIAKIKGCGAILDSQDPASRNKNYWTSIYTAIYSELRDRSRALGGKKKQEFKLGERDEGNEVQKYSLVSETQKCSLLSEVQKCPAVTEPQKCPVVSETQKCPVGSDTQKCPVLFEAQKCPVVSETKKSPVVFEAQKCPVVSEAKKSPIMTEVQKENHKVPCLPEKPTKLTQNSVLRQDETNKEKTSVPLRDNKVDNGRFMVQQQSSNNKSLEPQLLSSCSVQKNGEQQVKQDKSKIQAKHQSSWNNNYSQNKSWHIPETVRLKEIWGPVDASEMGNGIKKVRIPAQNPSVIDLTDQPFADFEALDEILKDLGAFEERENRLRESSQEHHSPTGVPNDFWCSVCLRSNGLISCNNCPKVFHRECHIPIIGFPLPAKWTCILCQEITPLPPGNYSRFQTNDLNIANRLLLEMFCQVDASAPFRHPVKNSSCAKSICLLDIKSKLAKGRYISIWDFIQDVKTLFKNCYRFRQAETNVVLHAQSLEEIFNRLLLKFIPHYPNFQISRSMV